MFSRQRGYLAANTQEQAARTGLHHPQDCSQSGLRRAAGLPKTSFAICHQVTTLDRAKMTKRIGTLPPAFLHEVEEGLGRRGDFCPFGLRSEMRVGLLRQGEVKVLHCVTACLSLA